MPLKSSIQISTGLMIGSWEPSNDEMMLQDALNRGIPATDVELREVTHDELMALIKTRDDLSSLKGPVLTQARAIREIALGRLGNIAGRAVRNGDTTGIAAACDAATLDLLNITSIVSVVNAANGAAAKDAIIVEWRRIAANLLSVSPTSANAFTGLDL